MTKLWVSKCIDDMCPIIIARERNKTGHKIPVHKEELHLNVLVQDLSVPNKLVYFVYYLLNCFNLGFY